MPCYQPLGTTVSLFNVLYMFKEVQCLEPSIQKQFYSNMPGSVFDREKITYIRKQLSLVGF